MKNLIFTLFLSFSLIPGPTAFAGNSSLIFTYPPANANYNKLILENAQGTTNVDCTKASNAGLLFMSANTLQMCTNDGTKVAVPYPETCFNQFCSGLNVDCSTVHACPPGYTEQKVGGNFIAGSFKVSTVAGTDYWASYSICCSTGAVVSPT